MKLDLKNQNMGNPIPEGLECGDQFTDEELVQLRKLREIVTTSEWLTFLFFVIIR